jgi:hypothetical protein
LLLLLLLLLVALSLLLPSLLLLLLLLLSALWMPLCFAVRRALRAPGRLLLGPGRRRLLLLLCLWSWLLLRPAEVPLHLWLLGRTELSACLSLLLAVVPLGPPRYGLLLWVASVGGGRPLLLLLLPLLLL